MKIIDVLNMIAKGEIKDKSTLLVANGQGETFEYVYYERYHVFRGRYCSTLEDDFEIDKDFLNFEAELTPPKEKKYLIMLNARGLRHVYNYVHYCKDKYLHWIEIGGESEDSSHDSSYDISRKSIFTKKEMQDIELLKMFLEDMEGKFGLIEVEDNESMDS